MREGKRLNSASSKISKSDKGCGVMVLSKDFSVKGGSPVSSRSPRGCFTFNSVSQNKTPTPQTRIGDGSEVQIPTLAPVMRSLGSSQTLSGTRCRSPQPPPPGPTYTRRPPPEIPPPSRSVTCCPPPGNPGF